MFPTSSLSKNLGIVHCVGGACLSVLPQHSGGNVCVLPWEWMECTQFLPSSIIMNKILTHIVKLWAILYTSKMYLHEQILKPQLSSFCSLKWRWDFKIFQQDEILIVHAGDEILSQFTQAGHCQNLTRRTMPPIISTWSKVISSTNHGQGQIIIFIIYTPRIPDVLTVTKQPPSPTSAG